MITEFEKKIANLIKDEEKEHIIIICNKDNHIYFQNNGNDREVNCPVYPDLLEDAVMIHNHPVFKWIEQGLKFEFGASWEDIRTAQKNKVSRLLLIENTGQNSTITEYKITI